MRAVSALIWTVWTLWAADVPPPLKHYNSYINTNIVAAIKATGAEWEAYDPDDNPLRIYTDQQLKGMMALNLAKSPEHSFGASSDDPKLNILALLKGLLPRTPEEPLKAFNFPTSYNWSATTEGAKCAPSVLNQGTCGCCYAFATVTAFSARKCQAEYVAKGTSSAIDYSMQDLVACHKRTMACAGGVLDLSHFYLEEYGVTPLSCQPYTESTTSESVTSLLHKCYPSSCTTSGSFSKSFCKQGSSVLLLGSDRIKNELYQRGPLATSMKVYTDFLNYKSGIYKYASGSLVGGHAIVLMGWGKQGTTNFWIAQNSWGSSWGERGFFRIDMSDTRSEFAPAAVYCIPLV